MRVGKHWERCKAIEVPCQFTHFRNAGLAIEVILFYVKSEGQPGGGNSSYIICTCLRIFDCGQRMKIRDEKERLIAGPLRKLDSRNDCTEKVAKMRTPTTLYACKNSCH